jgi:hypothetical protein
MAQNISLDRVANTLSQASFIINHEGSNISSSDVYALCADVEDALSGLLVVAQKIEQQERKRIEHQVSTFDRNQQVLDFSCDL